MDNILALQGGVISFAAIALIAVKVYAFVDASVRRPDAYVAADKMTKKAWLLILGLSAAAALVFPRPLGLFSILGTVASFVYLLDARPALVSVTRRR